jgi:hypothetical protein
MRYRRRRLCSMVDPEDVDGRHKAGHDGLSVHIRTKTGRRNQNLS